MKKHDKPLLDGRKDTSNLKEVRDVIYGNGQSLSERKDKKKKDKENRIDE